MNSLRDILADLRSPRALPALSYGAVIGVLLVVIEISLASMVFSGPLAPLAARGAGLTLFGAVAMSLACALFSSFPGLVSQPQDAPAAVLAGAAASMAGALALAPAQARFATVAALMALACVGMAALFFVVGRFRLANLVRFLPYPVVGGFLAGSGILLGLGGLGVMTGVGAGFETLGAYFSWPVARFWIPGAAFALAVFAALSLRPHFLLLPGAIVLGLAGFHAWLLATGTSLEAARQGGWLLTELPAGGLWPALGPADLAQVRWDVVLAHAPEAFTAALLALLGLLLNVGGIELGARRDLNMEREMFTTAGGGLLMALGGGFPGYPALSLSLLGPRTGVASRLIPLAAAAVCAGVLLAGGALLALFPRPLLGGLVLLLGLLFVSDWLVGGWKRLTRMDYAIVALIAVTIVHSGFLTGVGLGLGLAVLLFVVRMSRVPVVAWERSGAEAASARHRPVTDRVLLRSRGGDLRIFGLRGFLFFGSANLLGERVGGLLRGGRPPRFVVMDMAGLDGYDISAVNTVQRMAQRAQAAGAVLLLAAPPRGLFGLLDANASPEAMAHVRPFPDLDAALEWAEDRLLEEEHSALGAAGHARRDALFDMAADDVARHLEEMERFEALAERLGPALERRELASGEELFRQGEDPHGAYMVLHGALAVMATYGQGAPQRIRSLGPGTLAAPMAALRAYVAPGTAVAEGRTVVGRLSRQALARLEEADPRTALAFHKLVARALGRRAEGR